MKIDYHLHTEYSYDSNLKAEDLINKAISLSYDAIAITEHLDLLPYELSRFGLPAFHKYFKNIATLKEKYASAPLRFSGGLEIGDFQRVRSFADDLLAQFKPELILGAVHFLTDHTNVAMPLKHPLSAAEIAEYYRHNLDLVSQCQIKVLAHLGVYKRYYGETPDESHCQSLIRDIFQTMIDRRIALEINFSSLRKPYGRLTPEPGQIELYRSLGGKLFSIGSDSHQLDHFDTHYEQLPAWLFSSDIQFPLPGLQL